jgi:hypothetical protein
MASCVTVSTCQAAATGTDASKSAEPMSVAMRIGRRRTRSTQAPAGSATTSHAALVAAAITPTMNGLASRPMAINGNTRNVMVEPSSLTVSPANSTAILRSRSRLRGRVASTGADTGGA